MASLAAIAWAAGAGAQPVADILIRGGTIYDGSEGMKPFVGDVVISGERITYVGPRANVQARRTIDAKGLAVAPGFIDPHTHADHFIESRDPRQRQVPAWLAQGVTTVFVGVDGNGKPEIAERFAALREHGVGVNVASYVGFGAIRPRVVGQVARAPTEAELAQEKALVAKGMCEGAIGLSTGLFYVPQSYSKTNEVVELAREAARRGGVYDTHTRDYSNFTVGFMNSYQEALTIGKEAGIPVHLSHIKVLGPVVWGKSVDVIKLIDDARAAGQKVTASQYPYTGNGTSISAMFLPNWALDGGREALLKRLDEPATLERIKAEMTANLNRTGGAGNFLFRGRGEPWSNKYLDAVAKEWGLTPVDAALRIVRQGGSQSMIGFVMSEEDIANFMKQPWAVTDSDGGEGHPREYGTFPLKYQDYVVKKKVITLPFFIRHSSGLTADIFGIKERGYLRNGYFADVVVFDPKTYAPKNDFAHYDVLAAGVTELLVNGKAAIDGGRMTAVLSGRPLPHTPTPGTCG
ncbi:amidohydrolase family protein [Sphingomonas sp. XMGL2]|uniref:Amidohydrolase family protein n=1 Tax=Sphingomonas quercus TaxID=2842451 RepID=A0ABS6BGZ4_9SPHN|nr:amidohydrolase family protein [Sphingomonas quercus]MBU3077573.1 amidohydrolase family protein [Sphingomonas quercus]